MQLQRLVDLVHNPATIVSMVGWEMKRVAKATAALVRIVARPDQLTQPSPSSPRRSGQSATGHECGGRFLHLSLRAPLAPSTVMGRKAKLATNCPSPLHRCVDANRKATVRLTEWAEALSAPLANVTLCGYGLNRER